MKQKLYSEINDPRLILNYLEADCVDIQDHFEYIKAFTKVEEADENIKLSTAMVNKKRIEDQISKIVAPLKEDLKQEKSIINRAVTNLDQGGISVFGKVYCFPDYKERLMGLYDDRGNLVGTRPLSREENQLHINSKLNQASNE